VPYPPAVERWRPLVEKYFRGSDVEKALYVIQHESGGNPSIKASVPSEQSWGLFQANIGGGLGTGYTVEQLKDPETNIRIAAQAVYGGSGWSPWGEGVTYKGQKFGALGNNPYPSNSSGRGFTAPPPPGGTPVATPQQEDVAGKYFGKPYGQLDGQEQAFIDNKVKGLYGTEGLTGQPGTTGAATATNAPETRTIDGRVKMWDGAGFNIDLGSASAPSEAAGPRTTTSNGYLITYDTGGNIVNAVELPRTAGDAPRAQGAITTDDLLSAGGSMESPGVYVARNGQRYVQNPDKSWSANGTPSKSTEKLSPAQVAARASLDANKTNAEAQRIREGGAPTSQGQTVTSSTGGEARTQWGTLPDGSPNYIETDGPPVPQGGSSAEYYKSPQDVFGPPKQGAPTFVGQNVPTDDVGGSTLRTAGETGWAGQTLRAAGIIPTGDPNKDYIAALGADTKRNAMLAGGESPLEVQNYFDMKNRGTDVYARAKAVSAEEAAAKASYSGGRLPAAGTDQLTAANLRDFLTPENVQSYLPDDYEFAEGGSLTVGAEDDPLQRPGAENGPPIPGTATGKPRYTHSGNIQRDYAGGSYKMPATGGGYRPADSVDPKRWFDLYNQMAWNGNKPSENSYNSSLYQTLFPQFLQRYGMMPDIPGGGAWDWSGDRPTASIGGKTYRFANGGDMMLDEPVVGMGMQSGQPKFLAGEAGPEHLQFTPAGQMGQSSGMGGQLPQGGTTPFAPPMQPPVPQGNTDPRLMAFFAQTAAQRMRPRSTVPV
jgi:hypothetical protein